MSKKYQFFLPLLTYGLGDLFNILLYPEWKILNRLHILHKMYGQDLDIVLFLKLRLHKCADELFDAFPFISKVIYKTAVVDEHTYEWHRSLREIDYAPDLYPYIEEYTKLGYQNISRDWLISNCPNHTPAINNLIYMNDADEEIFTYIPDNYICLQPFSGMKIRDNFSLELLNDIADWSPYPILIMGSNQYPNISEKGIEDIKVTIPDKCYNLIDKTNLRQAYNLVKHAKAFIGTHSSLLNVAWFNNVKSLCVYDKNLHYITNCIHSAPNEPHLCNYQSDILHSYGFRTGITEPFTVNPDLTYDKDALLSALERLI